MDAQKNRLIETVLLSTHNQGLVVETTPGFNRLKLPRSICKKMVNTGQYESEWLLLKNKKVLTKFIVNATVFKELRLKVFLLLLIEVNVVSYLYGSYM